MERNLPKRKPLRLKNFDYSTPTAYFVTICSHNRINVFSHIVGAIHESPELVLTKWGVCLDEVVNNIPTHINAYVANYVIMPNHVHLIVFVGERAIRESPLQCRSVLSNLVGYIKMCASKRIRKENGGEVVWQRGYHDHIIRNREEYEKIYRYVCENPANWRIDCLYSETEE